MLGHNQGRYQYILTKWLKFHDNFWFQDNFTTISKFRENQELQDNWDPCSRQNTGAINTSWYKECPSSLQCDAIARLDNVTKKYVVLSWWQRPTHI